MDLDLDRDRPASRTWLLLLVAWGIALSSSLGALFVGEVLGQAPCSLCWFQRAFMFPLAMILGIACYRSDTGVWRYAVPLAAMGGFVAAFHSLQYLGVLPAGIRPCGSGPPCTDAEMTILGGIPLPFLSLGAFVAITGTLYPLRNRMAA